MGNFHVRLSEGIKAIRMAIAQHAGGYGVIDHPAIQTVAAGLTITGISSAPVWSPMLWLAVPGALYYCLVTIKFIQDWQPTPGGSPTFNAAVAKLKLLWAYDKPYIAAALLMVGAVMAQLQIQPPSWLIWVGAAAGVALTHSLTKGPTP